MGHAAVRTSSPTALVWLLGLAVGLVIGTIAYRWRSADRRIPPVERIANWREYVLPERSLTGGAGEVMLVAFTDYQCPHCRRLHEQIAMLQAKYPGKLDVTVRHFPLEDRHAFARAAALALECGGDTGKRREVDSVLFAHQDSLGRLAWGQVGARSGVPDTVVFERCVRQEVHAVRIDEDVSAARRLGVAGTPTVLVNELLLRGVGPFEVLEGAMRASLATGGR
jgi:protein-disulfide isomerase